MKYLYGINPWLSMWTKPRETIKSVINTEKQISIYFLSALFWFQIVLPIIFKVKYFDFLQIRSSSYLLIALSVVISFVIGFVWLYFMGFVLSIIGKFLDGEASKKQIRIALAWSYLPLSFVLVMWLILYVFSFDLFEWYLKSSSTFFIYLIIFIVNVWSFILMIQAFRQAQGFSLIKSIVYVFLSMLFLFVVFFLIYSSFLLYQNFGK